MLPNPLAMVFQEKWRKIMVNTFLFLYNAMNVSPRNNNYYCHKNVCQLVYASRLASCYYMCTCVEFYTNTSIHMHTHAHAQVHTNTHMSMNIICSRIMQYYDTKQYIPYIIRNILLRIVVLHNPRKHQRFYKGRNKY